MSELTERTNEQDIAAVNEVVLAYYDGMTEGDETKLARAFHPRACIVGNNQGQLEWQTLEDFVAECKEAAGDAGTYRWRIDGLSFQGDTALVRIGGQFAGEWYSDDLSMLRIDGVWRIVHKTWYVHPAEAAETQ
jgi:Putative lumazine-binding